MYNQQQSKRPQRRRYQTASSRGIPLLLVVFAVFLLGVVFLSPSQPTSVIAVEGDGQGALAPSALHITEAMTSNQAAFPDEKGSFPDWIELTNEGETPIRLDGYGLSDREDKIIFTFPSGAMLNPGEHIVIFCSKTSQAVQGMAYHANFKISSAGETLVLFGPEGGAIEHISVPAMTGDMVYASTPDGWIITNEYTPGFANTKEGYADFRSSTYLQADTLMLNELVASNTTSLIDEDGEHSDWIELYNNSDQEIDLSNYALSDNPEKRVKWRFPDGAIIGPREYYVVFASGKNRPGDGEAPPHANFRLSAEKSTVILSDILGQMIDQTAFEVLPADQSWGRRDDGERDWLIFPQATPGMANNQAGALEMNRRILAANTAGIAITEVMASNTAVELPNGSIGVDWIELFNYGNQTVQLGAYGLSDSVNHPRKWRFPNDAQIAPGQYLIVYCDKATDPVDDSGGIHTSFGVASSGETIAFCDPYGKILDKLVIPQLLPDLTYGRTPGQDGLFYYALPTPGAANGEGFNGFAQPPSFVTQGGMHPRPIQAQLNVPTGTEVRYTLDCTEPTLASTLYTGPFEIPATTVVRARSFQNELSPSPVVTQSFFISVYHTLPVVSLVTEPDNVWNPDTGMMADGPLIDRETQEPPWDDATYWKKLHYDGFVELYMEDGTQALSTGMNFHVMGQYSLDLPQKSFSVNAKKRFGTGWFEYPLFTNRAFEQYKSFALRDGGQDGRFTRVLDGLQGEVVTTTPGSTVLAQAWRPVIVYLNGEYWGHYNLRERVSRYFVAQHEGWDDPDAMDLLESDGTASSQINWGSNKDWNALMDYLDNHDLRDAEALQYVADRVDIDNMFDYYIFEMYFGNSDPGNIRFYKKHGPEGKWRWIFYDADWGLFDSTKTPPSFYLKEKGSGNYNINNKLIRKVLENPEMRDKFLRRMGYMFQNDLTPEVLLPLLDDMTAQIQPELQMHFNRWADEMHPKIDFDVPKNPEGAYNYWISRVARARYVISKRPNQFWGMAKEDFALTDAQMLEYFGPQPAAPPEE